MKRWLSAAMSAVLLVSLLAGTFVIMSRAQPLAEYAFKLLPEDYASMDSEGELKGDVAEIGGKYVFHKDGQAVSGELVFRSDYAIKEYNFRSLISPADWNGTITYSCSSDGKTFTPLAPAKAKAGDFAWSTEITDNYGSFGAADGVYFLRAEIHVTGTFAKVPALEFLQFNVFDPPSNAGTYAHTPNPSQAFAVSSEGTLKSDVAEIGGLYIFHDEAGTAVPGTITFKSDAPITDFNVRFLASAINWGGKLTLSASANGADFYPLTCLQEPPRAHNPGWNSHWYEYYGRLKREAGVYYLRVNLKNNGGFSKMPALQDVRYNTAAMPDPDTDYMFNLRPDENFDVSSAGTLKNNVSEMPGYYLFQDEENRVQSGHIIFKSDYPITDYYFRTVVSKNPEWAGTVTFSASKDGETYVPLNVKTVEDVQHHPSWGPSCFYHNYGTFTADAGYYYLRVELNAASFDKLPALHLAKFSALIPEKAASYEKALDPDEYSSADEDEGNLQQVDAHWTFRNGDQPAKGSLVFESSEPITDYAVDSILSQNAGFGGTLTFLASKDGVTYTKIQPVNEKTSEHNGGWGPSYNHTHWGRFDPTDGILYLRIDFKPASFNMLPGLLKISYNKALPVQPDSYQFKLTPDQNFAEISETGTLKTGIQHLDAGYYVFHDAEDKAVPGEVVFKSDTAITDYNFRVLQSNVGWGGDTKFYASKDGGIYDEIPAARLVAQAHPNGAWDASYIDFYGRLKGEDGYEYIKIKLNANGGFDKMPAFAYLEYNAKEAVLPDYRKKITGMRAGAADTTGVMTEAEGIVYFRSGGNAVGGKLVFEAESVITNYNFRSLISKNPDMGVITYSASKDGAAWVPLTPKMKAVSEHHPSWGPSWYYENYGTLNSKDGYRFLRAEYDAKAGNITLGVAYLEYNALDIVLPAYTGKIQGKDAVAADTTGTITEAEGIVYFKDGGAAVSGNLVFASKRAFTDYNFRTLISFNPDWAGTITFSASKDGVSWDPVTPKTNTISEHNGAWGPSWYRGYYGTLDAQDGYLFLRAEYHIKAGNITLGVAYLEYNQEGEKPAAAYSNKVTPDQYHSIDSAGQLVKGVGEIVEYYVFRENGDISGNGRTVAGKAVYYSKFPILEFNFRFMEGAEHFGGDITFSASKDGAAWTVLDDLGKQIIGRKSEAWKDDIQNKFGAFTKEDDIHYLRVEINANGAFALMPNFHYLEYNTFGVERPGLYKFKQSAEESHKAECADSAAGLTHNLPEASGFSAFQKTVNGSRVAVPGKVVFKAEDYITDYSIRALVSKSGLGGGVTFSCSSDGTNWTAFSPYSEDVKKHSDSWGDAWQVDFYGKFASSQKVRFVRVELNADGAHNRLPALSYMQFNTGDRYYQLLPNTPDIANLSLPEKLSDFKNADHGSTFKLSGMSITNNGGNSDFIGGNYGMVQERQDAHVILYTPGMKDFIFTTAYPQSDAEGYKAQYKAYGRKTQYGEETEIPLMRTYLGASGFQQNQYRPADRGSMDDYLYLRIEGKIDTPNMVQILDFKFFYEGSEPGPVPEDEGGAGEGTDRKGVKTINFIKRNMHPIRSENMLEVTNTIGNVDYIGTTKGLLTDAAGQEAFSVFRTDGITKFYVKVHMLEEWLNQLDVRIYVAPQDDDSQYVEVPVTYELTKDQPKGWISVEYMPEEGESLPQGSNFLKFYVGNGGREYQMVRIDYEYKVIEKTNLPKMIGPDAGKGEKELLDTFEGDGLTVDMGGKAHDMFQLQLGMISLGEDNGSVRAVMKQQPYSDGFLIYKAPGVTSIDLRGYRNILCEQDPVVWVSADGTDWMMLEDYTWTDTLIFGGPKEFSQRLTNIPEGMNYVKIDIPDIDNLSDLVLHTVQLLYGGADEEDGGGDVKTGAKNLLPVFLLMPLACATGLAVMKAKRPARKQK